MLWLACGLAALTFTGYYALAAAVAPVSLNANQSDQRRALRFLGIQGSSLKVLNGGDGNFPYIARLIADRCGQARSSQSDSAPSSVLLPKASAHTWFLLDRQVQNAPRLLILSGIAGSSGRRHLHTQVHRGLHAWAGSVLECLDPRSIEHVSLAGASFSGSHTLRMSELQHPDSLFSDEKQGWPMLRFVIRGSDGPPEMF